MTRRAVAFLAERFASGLIHPGGEDGKPFAIPLPGLRNTAIPSEQAEYFASAAGMPSTNTPLLVAEAVVHVLTVEGGYEIVPRVDLEELQAAVAEVPDVARIVKVWCPSHNSDVLHLTVGRGERVDVNCSLLAQALKHHAPEGDT